MPSRAVHRILSYIDFMPKIMPPFGITREFGEIFKYLGFKQMYEKRPKQYDKPMGPERRALGKLAPRL